MTKTYLQKVYNTYKCGTKFNLPQDKLREDLLIELLAERFDLPQEAVQLEMLDFFKIVAMGAKKYAMNNWLDPNGVKCTHKSFHDSMFHHLAESYAGYETDTESGEHPLLHLQCRSAMSYVRSVRGIDHDED